MFFSNLENNFKDNLDEILQNLKFKDLLQLARTNKRLHELLSTEKENVLKEKFITILKDLPTGKFVNEELLKKIVDIEKENSKSEKNNLITIYKNLYQSFLKGSFVYIDVNTPSKINDEFLLNTKVKKKQFYYEKECCFSTREEAFNEYTKNHKKDYAIIVEYKVGGELLDKLNKLDIPNKAELFNNLVEGTHRVHKNANGQLTYQFNKFYFCNGKNYFTASPDQQLPNSNISVFH